MTTLTKSINYLEKLLESIFNEPSGTTIKHNISISPKNTNKPLEEIISITKKTLKKKKYKIQERRSKNINVHHHDLFATNSKKRTLIITITLLTIHIVRVTIITT